MKLNPFHPKFGLTKHSVSYRHSFARRGFKKHGVNNMVSIASFAGHHTDLHKLCQKYGTDKGHTDITTHNFGKRRGCTHDYASVYDLLFSQSRNNIKHLLECGIATLDRRGRSNPKESNENSLGPSLRMWREYFAKATITGIDIDLNCLFTDERIETYQCDQTNSQSIKQFLNQIPDRKFDIVIDDGLHEYQAGITLFENVVDRLTDYGIYVIEDIRQHHVWQYAEYFKNKNYATRFFFMPKTVNFVGETLLVITNNQGMSNET